jgi:hypothetical protein
VLERLEMQTQARAALVVAVRVVAAQERVVSKSVAAPPPIGPPTMPVAPRVP